MTDMTGHKAAARAAARARRAALRHAAAEMRAQDRLADFLSRETQGIVAGYVAIRSEIDPAPVMARLVAAGRALALPVVQGPGQPLAFRAWHPGVRMLPGAFGALVPAEGAWVEPQVLIVPLLAFDRRGFRLGYGGGFYDRTLAVLRARGPAMAVGFAFAGQEEAGALPVEPTDAPLDALVTEAGLWRW